MDECIEICHSDDPAWLEHRRTGIGASEMAAILGESTWGSPLSIYASKMEDLGDVLSDVEAIEWGHRLEPVILAAYAERAKRGAEPSGMLLRSKEHPWALCTLDGLTWERLPEDWPLEIKTGSEWKKEDWAEGPPRPYQIQVQHQMLVTGKSQATIACLLGGQRLVWCDVPRDEVEIRRIIRAGSEFWSRVERRDPPEPDGTDASGRALARLYPEDDGSVVELPNVLGDVIAELEDAKLSRKASEERVSLLEQRIKAALGTSTTGFVGRWIATWKEQTRAEHVVKASTFRVLRVKQAKEQTA